MAKISREDAVVYGKTGTIIGIVLVIFLIWLWWTRIYTSKSNVFNAMLSNSLSTYGVTKTVQQNDQSGNLNQASQAQFGATNLVEVKTDINQPTEGGEVKVTTQTLATPSEDFVRYTSIDMPAAEGKPKIDFSPLLKEWGKTAKAEGGGASFSEATFGIVPFGNLPAAKRDQLLGIIHGKNVYKTDYSKTEVKHENGRTVYVYSVEVNLQGYAELLKTYDAMLGLKQMQQLNPEDYASSEPIKATFTVDKLSRNLVKIVYDGGGRDESLAGYGIHKPVDIPQNAINRQELESKLQGLLSQEQ